MVSPVCAAQVTNVTGDRIAGPCVLPIHHSFFHLWVGPQGYSWHWNGPERQVMGDVSSEEPTVRILINPPGWLSEE
jgi:hypothetical protein